VDASTCSHLVRLLKHLQHLVLVLVLVLVGVLLQLQ
jgi:hypothetical protein